MKLLVVALFVMAGSTLGCATNYFNIPTENFAAKVKVLGVAPILIDADSDIIYPQKELLLPLLAELNRKYEPLLVRKLQSSGNFYAVILLNDEPQQFFSSLIARREKRDDASIQYNKHFWKNYEIGAYIKKNRLDAVMLIVVSGLTKNSKVYSSNLLRSLETNFNFLTMTAQIIDSDGTVLWEYPNFRGRLLTYYPLLNLQYPDFNESEANLSNTTELRFKSLAGIRRAFEQKKSDWMFRETEEPEVYGKLFDEMISLIKYPVEKRTNEAAASKERKPLGVPVETPKTVNVPVKTVPVVTPPLSKPTMEAPAPIPTPKNIEEPPVSPTTAPNEVAPAT